MGEEIIGFAKRDIKEGEKFIVEILSSGDVTSDAIDLTDYGKKFLKGFKGKPQLRPLGPDRGPETPSEIEAMNKLVKGE
jgi:hypothetical protein